jgi:hypothetical protein
MKRWIIFGLFVTSVLCIGTVAYIRFCTNLRRQAIRDLETFTISLGGRFNTDLQDGGSWVYLDNVIITKTQDLDSDPSAVLPFIFRFATRNVKVRSANF